MKILLLSLALLVPTVAHADDVSDAAEALADRGSDLEAALARAQGRKLQLAGAKKDVAASKLSLKATELRVQAAEAAGESAEAATEDRTRAEAVIVWRTAELDAAKTDLALQRLTSPSQSSGSPSPSPRWSGTSSTPRPTPAPTPRWTRRSRRHP